MIVEATDRLDKNKTMQMAYKDGTYFASCGGDYIVTNKVLLLGTFSLSYFDRICITEFREAEANPATSNEVQEMGFSFGIHLREFNQ
jgi:hypothetical protein